MTDYKDIQKMSDSELTDLVAKEREGLRALRFGKAERNSSTARNHKKAIARALTEVTVRTKTSVTK